MLDNDHDEEGIIVLANLHGGGDVHNEHARAEFREIKANVLQMRAEGERSYAEMWSRYRKRLLIACSAQAFAQMNGINVISYYVCSPSYFNILVADSACRLLWSLNRLAGLVAMQFS